MHTLYYVYSFGFFMGLNYKNTILALRQSFEKNLWKYRICSGFYNGTACLLPSVMHPLDLYMLTTMILFIFLMGNGFLQYPI